jgi:predicted dehydrogenase
MAAKHVLILGSGSVGRRHARNLAELGCRISAMDPRADRLRQIAGEVRVEHCAETVDEALQVFGSELDGAVIASPPHVHVDQALAALAAGLPVLLEKPVCPGLADAERLAEAEATSNAGLLLGYTWRWWPPLADVRKRLAEGAVGTLRHVRFVMSAHLADWHPWERYQDFFMARSDQGGGALLDESHWVDLALWFFGMPANVTADIGKVSDLDIDTDDNVDMLLRYHSGLRVSIHLDLYGRPHDKSIRFSGESGSILWTADPNRVSVAREASGPWHHTDYTCERNDMFAGVAAEFLSVLEGSAVETCTLGDGVAVLRVLEAVRHSSSDGRTVALGSV